MADEDAPLDCALTTSASARCLLANLATVRGATGAPLLRAGLGNLASLAAAASRALDELFALAVSTRRSLTARAPAAASS